MLVRATFALLIVRWTSKFALAGVRWTLNFFPLGAMWLFSDGSDAAVTVLKPILPQKLWENLFSIIILYLKVECTAASIGAWECYEIAFLQALDWCKVMNFFPLAAMWLFSDGSDAAVMVVKVNMGTKAMLKLLSIIILYFRS